MTAALAARGPDQQAHWKNSNLYLGHTRLAIIDRQGGGQPMVGADTGCVLVFNGEIYNFVELRRELERLGHRFASKSDTEVLLRAYEEYGPDCASRIEGMFAFVVWDPREQSFFMARDRLGKKPLYYVVTPQLFAFASEPKSLMHIPAVRDGADVDPLALSDFLSLGYILTPKSAFKNIRRLPAASSAIVAADAGEPQISRYWQVADRYRESRRISQRDQLEQFQEILDDAVRIRLNADVPVGLYLSGGLDSAAVAASLARVSSVPPRAYCMSFKDQSYDESANAAMTARHLGLELSVLSSSDAGSLQSLIAATDEPFADTSIMPSMSLNQAARRHVTVALGGDGADELFAGYPTYLADALYSGYRYVPPAVHRALEAGARRFMRPSYRKGSMDYKIKQFLAGYGLDRRRAHYSWRTIFSEEEKRRMMTPELAQACHGYDPYDAFAAYFNEVSAADFLSQSLYVDLKTWLQDDILVKVDRASMAYGLEVRSPFLDRRMVEFAATLPRRAKFGWFRRKRLLRAHLRDKVPPHIIAGGKKGFGAPTSRHGTLSPAGSARADWTRADFHVDEHREDATFKRFALGILDAFADSRADSLALAAGGMSA